MPLVSVIVPIYNVEDVLDLCVQSLLSQTFSDFELILIDDGSSDASWDICNNYQETDSRVRAFHKDNGGVSTARNLGIEKSIGKYILFVDSDDYVEREYIETLVNFKVNHKDIDNIWCHFKTVKDYNFSINNILDRDIEYETTSVKSIMDLHERWLDSGPVCKLYDRKIIIENGIFFPTDISLGEDLSFNFEYLDNTNGSIAIINSVLYYYFSNNNNSLSNRYYPNMFELYKRLNNMMYNYLIKWNCDLNQITKLYNASFYKYEVSLQNTFNIANTESTKDKFRYNNKILKSEEFQKAFSNGDFSVNVLYKIAYSFKNYRMIMFVDKLFKLFKNR